MRRVAVVGVPGAGKSALAREIGRRCALPVIHLDAHFFEPGWKPKPEDRWEALYEKLVARDRWVIDGAFAMGEALKRADTIVVLDLPRRHGIAGALRRNLLQRRAPPPDFAPGCRERFDRQFLQLLRFIWRYPETGRRELEAALESLSPTQKVVRLRSRREAEDFVVSLERDPAAPAGH